MILEQDLKLYVSGFYLRSYQIKYLFKSIQFYCKHTILQRFCFAQMMEPCKFGNFHNFSAPQKYLFSILALENKTSGEVENLL
jgi:hypothetical protein